MNFRPNSSFFPTWLTPLITKASHLREGTEIRADHLSISQLADNLYKS